MPEKKDNLGISKSDSWKMFDHISNRYDFLNRVLSLGQDLRWRRQLSKFLPKRERLAVLDLATGTADVLLILYHNNPRVVECQGIDKSDKMLDIGRRKINDRGLGGRILLTNADAHKLPFEDGSYDVTTIAFGIRNMHDPKKVLSEMHRVLKKNGRALVLEFSLPRNPLLRFGHLFYLRVIVPVAAFLLSGEYKAYRYLNRTIEKFPYGKEFCAMMKEAGFTDVKAHQLMLGAATIYQGDKT